jgi:A/G-specific adenine glycosylase
MNKKEREFIKTVKEHYARKGRHTFPWRKTHDPYRIMVSEIMLQQTQADRVVKKYEAFLEKFPTVEALARAPLGSVLREWQGLGYNRRAKMLHDCAKTIVSNFRSRPPKTMEELRSLPGIGPYTAGAIMAFAFNTPVPIIETNIRSVYLHHFYNDDTDVRDKELFILIERTLDMENPGEWYAALMDYGSYIKKTIGNPNSRSKHYTKQTSFKGSDREIRGAILRLLSRSSATRSRLLKELPFEDIRIDAQIKKLEKEALIRKERAHFSLPQ